jgi:hypothetical protein
MVAVVGVVAGLGFLVFGEGLGAISEDTAANLGVVSILCSLIAIPPGVIGWRWAERRRQNSSWARLRRSLVWTFVAWLALFIWALGQDTP